MGTAEKCKVSQITSTMRRVTGDKARVAESGMILKTLCPKPGIMT
jgi:hypothetical protein